MSIEHNINSTLRCEATYWCDAPGCDNSVTMINPSQEQLGLDQLGWHCSGVGEHYCPKCWVHLKPQLPPAPPQAHHPSWPSSLWRMLSEGNEEPILQLQNGDLLWDSHLERIRVVDWLCDAPKGIRRATLHLVPLQPKRINEADSVSIYTELGYIDGNGRQLYLLQPQIGDWVRIGSDPDDRGQVLEVSEELPVDSGYLRLKLARPWLDDTFEAVWEAESVRVCQELPAAQQQELRQVYDRLMALRMSSRSTQADVKAKEREKAKQAFTKIMDRAAKHRQEKGIEFTELVRGHMKKYDERGELSPEAKERARRMGLLD